MTDNVTTAPVAVVWEAEAAERRAARNALAAEAAERAELVRAEREAEAAREAAERDALDSPMREAADRAEAARMRADRARRVAAEAEAEATRAAVALARWQAADGATRLAAWQAGGAPIAREAGTLPRDPSDMAGVRVRALDVPRVSLPAVRRDVALPVADVAAMLGRKAERLSELAAERPARHGHVSMRRAAWDGYRKAVDTIDGSGQTFLVSRAGVRVEHSCAHAAVPCDACRNAVAVAAKAADKIRANGKAWRPVRKARTVARHAEREAWERVTRVSALIPLARVGGRGREAEAELARALAVAEAATAAYLALDLQHATHAASDGAWREVVEMPQDGDPHACPSLTTLEKCGAAARPTEAELTERESDNG